MTAALAARLLTRAMFQIYPDLHHIFPTSSPYGTGSLSSHAYVAGGSDAAHVRSCHPTRRSGDPTAARSRDMAAGPDSRRTRPSLRTSTRRVREELDLVDKVDAGRLVSPIPTGLVSAIQVGSFWLPRLWFDPDPLAVGLVVARKSGADLHIGKSEAHEPVRLKWRNRVTFLWIARVQSTGARDRPGRSVGFSAPRRRRSRGD